MELIMQEVSAEPYIEIPEEVQEVYKLWRPSPLIRAKRLEKALDTPAKIYYKYEGVSPAGSHKPNTSVPQAYYLSLIHISEPTRLRRISYAVFCLKKKKNKKTRTYEK